MFQRVHQELVEGFGITATAPVFRSLKRWEQAIPQYDSHSLALKQFVQDAEADQVYVCANWYGGVSLSDCIKKDRFWLEK